MLSINELTYRIGGRLLFDEASAQIGPRRRIGVVGRNGSGKSTLLRLIAGEAHPDGGEIALSKRTRVGQVAQFAPRGDAAVIEVVLAADVERTDLLAEAATAEHGQRIAEIHARLADIDAHAAPARAAKILAGLGFDEAAQASPIGALSGGWRMRVSLAAVLFSAPDLLLLDEPTNHLDLEAVLWLEGFLASYPRTFLMVSHDRALLNRAVDGILHLEAGKLNLYPGSYDRFERTRRERLTHQQDLQRRQERERQHIQSFIDRFRAKATKARQAQSRIKLLERMEPIVTINEEAGVTFEFPEAEVLPPPLLSLDRVSVGYSTDKPVLSRLSLRIDMEDRIGLLGQNGNGKSTFLRLLADQLQISGGSVTRSQKLRTGYFAQDQLDQLDTAETPYRHIARRLPDRPERAVRGHLGRFGFSQARADQTIGSLSGGERARLVLADICCGAPQLLLLDEPTNHLDLEAREALLRALNDFNGAVILVTHDHHMLSLAVDRLWRIADGTCTVFDGDIESYRAELLAPAPTISAGNGEDKRPSRRDERRQRAESRAAVAHLRKAARSAEQELERLTARRTSIEASLADPALYSESADRVTTLNREKADVERRIAETEERWLHANEKLDAAGGADA
ncbi:MAG: ATP-binding cassette domain-containing protein [Alphaproteobacteria bacterium]|nr:ATP-binding cassette domain-containing protein [Alphaproteobacteria bacterium]